jgi:hypothetical protein
MMSTAGTVLFIMETGYLIFENARPEVNPRLHASRTELTAGCVNLWSLFLCVTAYRLRRYKRDLPELKTRGVEFDGPPKKEPWGTYAMFKDSEGNSFVVGS